MGATTFSIKVTGTTAKKAFDAAVKQAQHDYGHSGYTGSIAEKRSFVMIESTKGFKRPETVYAYIQCLIDDNDPRIEDKWGPAGCIQLSENEWVFFGWASE